jgi:hypothetical protein
MEKLQRLGRPIPTEFRKMRSESTEVLIPEYFDFNSFEVKDRTETFAVTR